MAPCTFHGKPAGTATLILRSIKGIPPPGASDKARASIFQNVLVQPLQSAQSGKGAWTYRSWPCHTHATTDSAETHRPHLYTQVVAATKPFAARSANNTRPGEPAIPTHVYASDAVIQRVWRLGATTTLPGLPPVCQAWHGTGMCLRSRGVDENSESKTASRVSTRENRHAARAVHHHRKQPRNQKIGKDAQAAPVQLRT